MRPAGPILRWGIIGAGNVVEFKSGPSLALAERSTVAAVMRRDRAKAEEYAAKNGIPLATDDPDAILRDTDIDIVYIATPPVNHESYVLAAAGAGKHVLVEKPMALNAAQGERMVRACDEAGVRLFTAYYRRFYPQVRKMKEIVREGGIGTPTAVSIDIATMSPPDTGWREIPEISGGGLFIDVGSHRVDVMVYLLGDVEETAGVVFSHDDKPVERMVSLSVRFESGAVGSVLGDFHSNRVADRFCVFGTTGSIIAENLETPRFLLRSDGKTRQFQFDPLPSPHLGLMRHVEQVLLDGSPNETSGSDGLMTEKILDDGVRRHFMWYDPPRPSPSPAGSEGSCGEQKL